MFRRGRLALVVVLSGLSMGSVLGAAPATATHLTATGSPGGPTVPWGFNEDWGWPPQGHPGYPYFNTGLANAQMQTAGAIMPDSLSANRFHVQWADVEWRRGSYDWSRTDPVYQAMQQHTPRPVMVLYNTPAWASDPAVTCPAAPDPCAYPPLGKYDPQWKKFVQAATARYRNVRAIEIWNSPNVGRFWAPAANPKRYSSLLKAAHTAVGNAKSTLPVLVGGLKSTASTATDLSAPEFLRQVYANAGAAAFEGIASEPVPKAPFVETMWSQLNDLRAVRDGRGDGATRLWVKVAVSTDPATGVPLDQQGDVLVDLYHSVEGHDVATFIIHRLHDIGTDSSPQAGYWNHTGVMTQGETGALTPKPAYCELGSSLGTSC